MIFADIPPFYKEGMRLDVTVAAIGDSQSLENGYLVQTPLYGADNRVYAVAQGNVLTGGANVRTTSNLQNRYKVVGYISEGAIIEREIPASIVKDNTVTIHLNNQMSQLLQGYLAQLTQLFLLKLPKQPILLLLE